MPFRTARVCDVRPGFVVPRHTAIFLTACFFSSYLVIAGPLEVALFFTVVFLVGRLFAHVLCEGQQHMEVEGEEGTPICIFMQKKFSMIRGACYGGRNCGDHFHAFRKWFQFVARIAFDTSQF